MSVDVGCPANIEVGSEDFLQRLVSRALDLGVPTTGQLDLTYRCNFRCAHCYVGHLVGQSRQSADELGTAQFKAILSSVANMGCLFMTFSGGEPLLRPDFCELYTTARKLGMLVSVYTNGSLLAEEHARLFQEYPPDRVDISIYGASEETYRRVTGVQGAFDRVWEAIDLLAETGIRVKLKSMILKDNIDDIVEIEEMALQRGLDYRVDPKVLPRIDGSSEPAAQRVDCQAGAEVQASLGSYREELRAYAKKEIARTSLPGGFAGMYQCGAGRTSFNVDPHGVLRPCLFSRKLAYTTRREKGFVESWRAMNKAVRSARWHGVGGCLECRDRVLCGYCAGVFEMEGADPENPLDYFCELGRMRRQTLNSIIEEEAWRATIDER